MEKRSFCMWSITSCRAVVKQIIVPLPHLIQWKWEDLFPQQNLVAPPALCKILTTRSAASRRECDHPPARLSSSTSVRLLEGDQQWHFPRPASGAFYLSCSWCSFLHVSDPSFLP